MYLTSKSRFVVAALIDVALRKANGPVALVRVSQRQALSVPYLEIIFAKLRHEGIVKAVRGPGGGYSLARPVDKVTVADIVVALGNSACA